MVEYDMVNKKYNITKTKLNELHLEHKKTPEEIAEYYGCHRGLIYHYLKKFNIEKLPKYDRLTGKTFGRVKVKKFLNTY